MPSTTQAIVVKPVSQLAAFASRLFQPPKDDIKGIDPRDWYSPLQPVKPMGPADEEPKGFQFYAGQNLIWTPRPDAEYTAWELKDLATYPLARICIENVKDSISRIPWSCQLKPQPGESKKEVALRAKGNKELLKMNRFFERPDRENDWDTWLRPLVEDMLVIDAASILVRKTFAGEVAELRVMRGEMFTRYIDRNGYTPQPPDPAYAQIWWGVPLLNLTTEQLIYRPRNIVPRGTISSQLYGMSPTEQLALEIIPGRQRLEFVTNYYTTGSIPDVVQVIPKGVHPDKIAEAMQWMNSELAGNLAARRQWRMVQGFTEDGKPDQILFPKEKLLADAFDEMHIRKICFGYGTSPQRLMRMMGTRNAAAQQEAAEIEGLIPWLDWINNARNHIIQRVFGYTEIESSYDAEREPDPEKQANRLKTLVGACIITPNQAREEIGEEPMNIPEADELGVLTGTGFVPIGADAQLEAQQTLGTDVESQHARTMERSNAAAANKPDKPDGSSKPTNAVGKPNGKANGSGHSDVQQRHYGFAGVLDGVEQHTEPAIGFASSDVPPLAKAMVPGHQHKIDPTAITPQGQLALRRFNLVMHNRLKAVEDIVLREFRKRVRGGKIRKAKSEDALLRAIIEQTAKEWDLTPDEVEELYAQAALGGASLGSLQVSITDRGMLDKVNTVAANWARDRAAELVGKRRLADGSLIENPDARWAITQSTRDALQTIISNVFKMDSPTMPDVERFIQTAGIFSDKRASMIARTEVSLAQTQGNLTAWKVSGKVSTVEWVLSGNHDHDDECDENADNGPYDIDEVPDCPAHPNCDCVLVMGEIVGEE